MKKFLTFSLLVFSFSSNAQPDDVHAMRYARTITADDLKKHLFVIASDSLQGRETATEGERKAAAYIAAHFKSCGLLPHENAKDYLAPFSLYTDSILSCTFSFNESTFELWKDFIVSVSNNETASTTVAELIFAGYGISDSLYDDYKNIDVKNKIVIAFAGEPKRKKKYLISKTANISEWSRGISKKIKAAINHGATGLIIINYELKEIGKEQISASKRSRLYLTKEKTENIPSITVTEPTAEKILGTNELENLIKKVNRGKSLKPFSIKATCSINYSEKANEKKSQNVVGYVEGSDLKNEFVILTAHYDHLGMHDNKIYYGADDDGSGTVAVMEMAEAFAKAKAENHGPRRSIVFMTVSGEEKGLLGSKYYTEHPLFPLESTLVNLNTDMIGRYDSLNSNDTNYVYIIGADRMSTELHKISENTNNTYTHLKLNYKYNDKSDPQRLYTRSDHYNFVKKGIPIIFYFDGLHEDYHKTTDTPDKISYTLMQKRAQLIFYTAWELANRSERLILDNREGDE